jgi:hypothetical protein
MMCFKHYLILTIFRTLPLEKKKYTDEELKQYIDSYLTNRYIELFKNLILDYEPNEIIPSDSFSDLIKYKYNMSTFELSSIKKMVNAEIANDSQKGIYFKLKSLKDYVNEKNRSLQQSISLIEKYHETIGSDHKATLFHIYVYLSFDISAATDNYAFANLLSYTVSKNMNIREKTIYDVPYRFGRRTSQYTSNKIKKSWVEKSTSRGIVLEKRKPTFHYMNNSMRQIHERNNKQ